MIQMENGLFFDIHVIYFVPIDPPLRSGLGLREIWD